MARNNRNKKNRTAQNQRKGTRARQQSRVGKSRAAMVFTKQNYLLMLLGVVLVIVGFTIMRMENEVDGFISLYIAPLIILGGYLEIIYAILWRSKNTADAPVPPESS